MKKHSKKLAIFFSFLPGAGHMYLGLIKQGMELMGLFFFVFFAVTSFNIEFFIIFVPVIWFYSVFDVNEKASKDSELKDGDLPIFNSANFTKSIKASNTEKYIAYILVAMGIISLVDNVMIPLMEQYFDYVIIRTVKDTCISAALIVIGIFMLKGKKVKKDGKVNYVKKDQGEKFEKQNMEDETKQELDGKNTQNKNTQDKSMEAKEAQTQSCSKVEVGEKQ